MADGRHLGLMAAILKNNKSPYTSNGLTDWHQIWHDYAY